MEPGFLVPWTHKEWIWRLMVPCSPGGLVTSLLTFPFPSLLSQIKKKIIDKPGSFSAAEFLFRGTFLSWQKVALEFIFKFPAWQPT